MGSKGIQAQATLHKSEGESYSKQVEAEYQNEMGRHRVDNGENIRVVRVVLDDGAPALSLEVLKKAVIREEGYQRLKEESTQERHRLERKLVATLNQNRTSGTTNTTRDYGGGGGEARPTARGSGQGHNQGQGAGHEDRPEV